MSTYQILVVDDMQESFEEYQELLEQDQEWFNLNHITNGIDALDLLKKPEHKIDLVLLDQDFSSDDVPVEKLFKDDNGIPDRTTQGILILQELRRVIGDELPIIFCTAYPESEYGEKARQLGAKDYLEKHSLSYEHLMGHIKKFLNIMEYPDLEQVLEKICAGKVVIDPKAKEWLLTNAKKRKRLAVETMTETVQIATKQSVGSSITMGEIMSAFDEAEVNYPPEPLTPADYCQLLSEKLRSGYTDFAPVRREPDCIILTAKTNDGQQVTLRVLEPQITLPTNQIKPILEARERNCRLVGNRALCRTLAIHHILLDQNDPFLDTDSLIVTTEEYTDPDQFISLRQYLNRHGEMPANQISIIETQLTPALNALHNAQIYHRHITPEKILMRQDKNNIEFKLSGYAESVFIDLDRRKSIYLPSEATSAKDEDIYALTVILYEMMTEKLPSGSITAEKVLHLLQTELQNQKNIPRTMTKAPAANDFEREVFNELKKLPSECVVFRNGVFRSGNSFRECDAVVVTQVGIYCIEVKYKAVSDDLAVESAAAQVQRHYYAFKDLIDKSLSWKNRVFVDQIIVFPDRHDRMTTDHSYTFGGKVGNVWLYSQKTVVNYITAQIANRKHSLTVSEVQQLADFIDAQATTMDLQPNRDLLYYRIKEPWDNLGVNKTFKAINERNQNKNTVVLVEHVVKERVLQNERENEIKALERSYQIARRIDHLQSVWQQKDLILDSRNEPTTVRDGVVCYEAFELAKYPSLTAFRNENPNLPILTRLKMISSLTEGLRLLHQANLAHRNLSPDRIVVAENKDGNPVPKFRDFRHALLSGFDLPKSEPYVTGEFQAPEAVQPSLVKGLKGWQCADIYALGAICYYLFFDKMPEIQRKGGRAVKIRPQYTKRPKHDRMRVVESIAINKMMNPRPDQRKTASKLSAIWKKVFAYFELAYEL